MCVCMCVCVYGNLTKKRRGVVWTLVRERFGVIEQAKSFCETELGRDKKRKRMCTKGR